MIALDTEIRGMAELNQQLEKAAAKIEHPKPMFARVSSYLLETFQDNGKRGVDADLKPMAPVSVWTRNVAKGATRRGAGKPVPLNNTGATMNAMAIWNLSDKGAEIGWRGNPLKIMRKMKLGKAGRMDVDERRIPKKYSGIRTGKKTGRDYARIKGSQGWFTKRVFGGKIAIKPRARDFMFLSKTNITKAGQIADKYVAGVVK